MGFKLAPLWGNVSFWCWLIGFAATLIYGIGHTFNYNRDSYVPLDEVKDIENQRTQLLAGAAE